MFKIRYIQLSKSDHTRESWFSEWIYESQEQAESIIRELTSVPNNCNGENLERIYQVVEVRHA